MESRHIEKIKVLLLVVIIFVVLGASGYMLLEGLTATDALLRTLLVFSTLGYGEVTTQTVIGKWFTMLLIVSGISVILYAVSGFMQAVIEGEISGSWKKHMTHRKLANLKDHAIVCGFGRVGRQVAEELAAENEAVVIVDRDDVSNECSELGYVFVRGDVCLDDNVFIRAGINSAKVVIIAFGVDSDSLSASVTARALNQSLFIVSRATSKQAESRLLRVGVNRVALPAFIGGYHMATMAMRPSVVDFLDLLIDSKRNELQIEELQIDTESNLVGQKVHDHFSGKRSGVALLAMKRKTGNGFLRPTSQTTIEYGDKLIVMGTTNQLDSLTKKA